MIDYLNYFFNPQHLFSLRPQAMNPSAVRTLLVVCLIFLFAGVLVQFVLKAKDGLTKAGYKKVASCFYTVGGVGLVYLFFAWQGISLLAARFWLVILAIVWLVWAGFITKYFIKDLPVKRQDIVRQKEKARYIP